MAACISAVISVVARYGVRENSERACAERRATAPGAGGISMVFSPVNSRPYEAAIDVGALVREAHHRDVVAAGEESRELIRARRGTPRWRVGEPRRDDEDAQPALAHGLGTA